MFGQCLKHANVISHLYYCKFLEKNQRLTPSKFSAWPKDAEIRFRRNLFVRLRQQGSFHILISVGSWEFASSHRKPFIIKFYVCSATHGSFYSSPGPNAWASGTIKDYVYVGNIWLKAWGMLLRSLIPITATFYKKKWWLAVDSKKWFVCYLVWDRKTSISNSRAQKRYSQRYSNVDLHRLTKE